MSTLLIIGLIIICAILWSDVAKLRARLALVEDSLRPHNWPEDVEEPAPLEDDPSEPATLAFDGPMPAAVPEWVAAEEAAPAPEAYVELELADDEQPRLGFEELFGRRLPIWAGGVTLAVAGFLIVKYSIDAGLLSPLVRVILGGLFGTALIAAAEAALRGDLVVSDARVRQSLAGAGIATLYATILVASNIYGMVGPLVAFLGMALVTLLAGFLSLRFGAPSALLGLVGGLAAPALVGSTEPNIPLLASYLALAVGGLCALSRDQRWAWLGVSALIGGFGWGLALLLGGALDAGASISLGLFILLLALAFPLLLVAEQGTTIHLAAGLVGCAQMAALVAVGGFAPLHWALFGLISAGIVWLSLRAAALAQLPSAGLAISLLLAGAWSDPSVPLLAAVLAGIVAIYAGAAMWRLWRDDGGLVDAVHIAVAAVALLLVPMLHFFDPLTGSNSDFALLALLGAAISSGAAALGLRAPARREDARFALLVSTGAALLVAAGALALPHWAVAPWGALVAAAILWSAHRSGDPRLEPCAWGFAALTLFLLVQGLTLSEIERAVGEPSPIDIGGAIRWLVPEAMALLFARAARGTSSAAVGEPFAVLFVYMAAAQLVPPLLLPLLPALLVAMLGYMIRPAPVPALVAGFALLLLWAMAPLAIWSIPAFLALTGEPFLATDLPTLTDTWLRLALPAVAIAIALVRTERSSTERAIGTASAALLALVAAHILFKQLLLIDSLDRFVALGLAERTLWEAILAGAAVVAWRTGRTWTATGLGLASLMHFAWFTLLLHNPLWSAQAVGPWLIPAYGVAFALLHLGSRSELPAEAHRALEWGKILLVPLFAISILRQLFAGSLLTDGPVGSAEDIIRSLLGALIAIAYLQWGIQRRARDWRIASLILMLATVAKVFLFDASGLDGLVRVASFAALGFSLIGVGWLYSRYLPDARGAAAAA